MANTIEFTGLSLFSGVGMLDEAVGIALAGRGIGHRVAAFCEWEASAASLLLARMEEQSVEPCPVWCGDLADFPAESFAGRIDVLTAGYPCQPYSVAGAKRGLRDHRALGEDGRGPIHHLLRIIGTVGPRFVFLENVWEAAKHFRPIGRRLVAMGYEVAPPFLCGAGAVGASHRRERMFVLARRSQESGVRSQGAGAVADGAVRGCGGVRESSGRGGFAGRRGEDVADGDGIGRERRPGSGWEAGCGAEYGDETMADGSGGGFGGSGYERGSGSQGLYGAVQGSEAMADSVRERRQQIPGGASGDEKADGRAGWHGSEPDGDHVAEGAVEAVADAECSEWRAGDFPCGSEWKQSLYGEREEGAGRNRSTGEDVEDAGCSERRRREEPAGVLRRGASTDDRGTGGTLAHATSGGQGRCDGAEPGNAAAFDGIDGGEIPFFAPGPDSGEWPGILDRWPWLAPATESGVCVVVDGVAVALDGARADSLRASGNGVVALAGSVAFEQLLRWTGWGEGLGDGEAWRRGDPDDR